jgi:3-deoxy-D-manno-octulosonate 8-phosphate phosphatase KdsC-like HAD superfamily phosphatase
VFYTCIVTASLHQIKADGFYKLVNGTTKYKQNVNQRHIFLTKQGRGYRTVLTAEQKNAIKTGSTATIFKKHTTRPPTLAIKINVHD